MKSRLQPFGSTEINKDELFLQKEIEKTQQEVNLLIEQLKGKSLREVKFLFKATLSHIEQGLIV